MTHDGTGVPVVTDGPFPKTREFLAGYWLIDVESAERAIEIAARTSAAPGPVNPKAAPLARRSSADHSSRWMVPMTLAWFINSMYFIRRSSWWRRLRRLQEYVDDGQGRALRGVRR
jgi:hypothetical protein